MGLGSDVLEISIIGDRSNRCTQAADSTKEQTVSRPHVL